MSRAAQAVARAVEEMRKTAKRQSRTGRVNVDNDEVGEIQQDAPVVDETTGSSAPSDDSQPLEDTMTKKKSAKAKTPNTPKAAKAPREKKAREKKVKAAIDGPITGVKASGETYLQLEFESGHITLTPTSNRTANRDLAMKAIKALLG